MQVAPNKVVTIAYTLKDDKGTVIDQASEQEPFSLIHGIGNIISGLETALEGKAAGDTLSVTIEPQDGYGEYNDGLTQVISKEMFEGVDEIKPDMQFHAQTDQGMGVVTVTQVEGDQVTIDGNHPLAGVTLNFDVNVIGVRDATQEELEHGHVHGEGGCDH